MIRETYIGIFVILSLNYLICLQTELHRKQTAKGFNKTLDFPRCPGAVDGKQVMQAPARSRSSFFNYKEYVRCDQRTWLVSSLLKQE